MVASRSGPKGAGCAPFGLAALVMILMPTNVGYQDLAALAAPAPALPERGRQPMIASPSLELHPRIPGEETVETSEGDAPQPDISLLAIANDPDPSERTSRLFFGDLVGSSLAGIAPWSPGEEPILMVPRAPDTDIKRR